MNTLGPSVPVSPAASKGRGEGAGADSAGFADAFDGAFSALGPRPVQSARTEAGQGTASPATATAPASAPASVIDAGAKSAGAKDPSANKLGGAPGLEDADGALSKAGEAKVDDGAMLASRSHYGLAQGEAAPSEAVAVPLAKGVAGQAAQPVVEKAPPRGGSPAQRSETPEKAVRATMDGRPVSGPEASVPKQAPKASAYSTQASPTPASQTQASPTPAASIGGNSVAGSEALAPKQAPKASASPAQGSSPGRSRVGTTAKPDSAVSGGHPAPVTLAPPSSSGAKAPSEEAPPPALKPSTGAPESATHLSPKETAATPLASQVRAHGASQARADDSGPVKEAPPREAVVLELREGRSARAAQDSQQPSGPQGKASPEGASAPRPDSVAVDALLRGDTRRGSEVLLRGARTPTNLSAAPSAAPAVPKGSSKTGAAPVAGPALEGLKPGQAKPVGSALAPATEAGSLARMSFDQRLAQANAQAASQRAFDRSGPTTSVSTSSAEAAGSGHNAVAPTFELRPLAVTPTLIESRMGPALVKDLQKQFSTLDEGTSRTVELRLDPPELGRVTVRISMVGDEARVAFTAAQGGAREALEAALPKLREMFEQAGLSLGDAQVGSGSGQDSRGRGRASEDLSGLREPLASEPEGAEGSAEVPSSRVNSPARGRLDLRV